MTLDVRYSTLNEILSQPVPLTVARYQRHYEWTLKEMEQLLSDLVESFRAARGKEASASQYFIGSFIFHLSKGRPIQVVDGQQRLVSLSIVLAVARDLMPGAPQRAQLDAYLTIPANPLTGAAPRQRLTLHRGDDSFFAKHIVTQGATQELPGGEQDNESHERIRKNANRAAHWLSKELEEGELGPFAHFVTNACRIVLISLDDEADAFRIFETVNGRGRPLRDEEVLRIALVEFATDEDKKRDELLRKWDTVERRVGPEDMPRFIAQWRIRQLGGKQSNRPLHQEMVESFPDSAQALAYLEGQLVDDATVFVEIVRKRIQGLGNSPVKQAIDKRLRSLALVDFNDWLPVAMIFIQRHRDEPEVLLERLKGLDRLAWLFFFKYDAVKIGQDRQRRFRDIVKHLSESSEFDPRTCNFDLSQREKAEMRDIMQSRIGPKWIPLQPLLVRLEHALAKGPPRERLNFYTIEHVLPLSPDHSYWYERFDGSRRVVREFAELIGNLCLVPYALNKDMDNKPFPEKKALVLEAGAHKKSALAADFEREDDWTKDIIQRRSRWLLNTFCAEFDVSVA